LDDWSVPKDIIDRAILRLAHNQHGLVARRQLLDLGYERWLVDDRVRSLRLIAVTHGVYSMGHTPGGVDSRLMAGLLFAGEGALLARQTAAAYWGLMQWRGAIHVLRDFNRVLPGRKRDSWLIVHRTRFLPDAEVAVHKGLAITSIERTLLDLAATLPRRKLESCFATAERLRLLDVRKLDAVLERGPGWKGVAVLRQVLDEFRSEITRTRSELEENFFHLCVKAGLESPDVNFLLEGLEVDCFWPKHRLVVEMDSREFHLNTRAFERDRRRDETLQRAGFKVLRLTYKRLQDDPHGAVESVLAMISH
jgi:very-short-patch-repair endonuclease